MIQGWTANAGTMITPTEKQIVSAYSAVSGYRAGHPESDQGAVELEVLNYWRKHGIAGRKIAVYASIAPRVRLHVRQAIYLFGGIYVGVSLPITAQDQAVWRLNRSAGHASDAGSWGGHAVNIIGYDTGGMTCVTWGGLKRMTWGFWDAYGDEAYGVVSPDLLNPAGLSPTGLNMTKLMDDLRGVV
jgi:hypothetical protein